MDGAASSSVDEGFVLAAGRELGCIIALYQSAIASVTADRSCTDGRRSAFGSAAAAGAT